MRKVTVDQISALDVIGFDWRLSTKSNPIYAPPPDSLGDYVDRLLAKARGMIKLLRIVKCCRWLSA
jgi:hypothetical protein